MKEKIPVVKGGRIREVTYRIEIDDTEIEEVSYDIDPPATYIYTGGKWEAFRGHITDAEDLRRIYEEERMKCLHPERPGPR